MTWYPMPRRADVILPPHDHSGSTRDKPELRSQAWPVEVARIEQSWSLVWVVSDSGVPGNTDVWRAVP